MRRALIPGLAMLLATLAGGCSLQQGYATAQAWQRLECHKINETMERERCLESTSASYEDYRRESRAARGEK